MKMIIVDILKSIIRLLGLSPIKYMNNIRGVPIFFCNLLTYIFNTREGEKFPFRFTSIYPVYSDRFLDAGKASGHYFHQDLWAAKKIYKNNPIEHLDVGSRIDGFISHLLTFRSVRVVDVRPLVSKIDGLSFELGDITKLELEDNSIESASCLHAIEHIGLGRYGDKVNHSGWKTGLYELQRILMPGGRLYLGVPIGEERLFFDAHRVFDPATIVTELKELRLVSFAYVDDSGDYHDSNTNLDDLPQMKYGCGLFEFIK